MNILTKASATFASFVLHNDQSDACGLSGAGSYSFWVSFVPDAH